MHIICLCLLPSSSCSQRGLSAVGEAKRCLTHCCCWFSRFLHEVARLNPHLLRHLSELGGAIEGLTWERQVFLDDPISSTNEAGIFLRFK